MKQWHATKTIYRKSQKCKNQICYWCGMAQRVNRSISFLCNHKAAMHGQLEAPRCSAGISQPDTPSKVIETTTTHNYHHQITFKKRHGNTKVKVSSTPIPKDLPPLLRARAVALSGKSVGLTLGENANVTELEWRTVEPKPLCYSLKRCRKYTLSVYHICE